MTIVPTVKNNWRNTFLLSFLCFFLLTPIGVFAQFSKSWSDWEVLHQDSDILVELRVYTPKQNSCVDKNKKFKFKYRVTGKYKTKPTYLNWKITYMDCNGRRYYQQNALELWKNKFEDISGGITVPAPEKQFTGDYIDKQFTEVKISSSKQEGSGLLPALKSKSPKSIKGLDKVFLGEIAELEVEGGGLGEGAEWIWYEGSCGKRKVGEGKKIKLNIAKKTTIFVRAEGKNNETKCARKTVDVDLRSSDPIAVVGKNNICYGDEVTLSVSGGSLGLNAQWVWYEDGCGISRIGSGPTISIQPRTNKRYYVRAESTLNTTTCVNLLVNVNFPAKSPKTIQAIGSTAICEGAAVTLRVRGEEEDSAYKWYSGNCGGTYIGTGKSIVLNPTRTTTYFVRTEGACDQSTCLSKRITVSKSSYLPASIRESSSNRKKILRVSQQARLASNAKWKWYKGGCGRGGAIGTGAAIKIKAKRKPITYFVRAEGNCSSNDCARIRIAAVKNNRTRFQNFNTIQVGFGIGLEYNVIEDIRHYTNYDIEVLKGIGIRGEGYFYPLLKDYFSLGVLSSIAVGTSPYFYSGGEVPNTDPLQVDKYTYIHANVGAEVALGFPSFKLLSRVNHEFQKNKLDRNIGNKLVAFDDVLNRDYIGIGLRIGSYKGGRNLDILYLLYRNNEMTLSEFQNAFSNMSSRLTGFQIGWKKQNAFSFKTNIYLPITQGTNSDNEKASLYFSLLIHLDRFY